MGDSETVVAQTSSVMVYTSNDYASSDHANDNAASGIVTSEAVIVGDVPVNIPAGSGDLAVSTDAMVTDNTSEQTQNPIDENANNTNRTLAKEEVPTTTNDICENVATSANEPMDMSHVSTNNSLNGINATEPKSTVSGDIGENGTSVVKETISEHQHGDASVAALSAEEERLWSILRANSLDFDAWTALIEETEKAAEGQISKIRKVYDAFLAEFPLCYGYWKKYADHEERLGSGEKVIEVYERAVQGVTYSVDMWLHYCIFAINTYGDPDTVRRLFERGLVYVGTDFLSFSLWDKYIEYEYSQQEWSRLAMIYTRILENPNQQLDRYFNSFRDLVAHRPLSELRTAEEAAAAVGATGQETEGEVHPDVVESKAVSAGLSEAEELEKYMTIREDMYNKAKEFQSKIIGFETAIKRPYFHVRPLNGVELENWHSYLDFIEAGGDFNKVCYLPNHLSVRLGRSLNSYEGPPFSTNEVVKLYERCLIACANYPEYWTRYILHMEASGSTDLAENALARATQVFVKRQPEIHLFAARFREHAGDIPGARAAYELVHAEISPGLLEAIIKHANMEHRLGNFEDACSLYEQAIAIEKGKEHSQTLPLLFAQYSRFVYLVSGEVEKAREILEQALENCQPPSKSLLEAVIHLESIQQTPKRIEFLDSLINKFISPISDNTGAASLVEREEVSSIFLEFLDLFGDAQSVKKAEDRHAKLFLLHKSTSESKKRHADDFLQSDKTKVAKSGVYASSPSVVGAYQTTPNQWAAGYGAQPQAWPQVTQAQGQNWNTAYTQQAAYGAYGNAYAQPQVQTSVPQTAAYGAYPPAYTVQTYPHVQAAAPATLTPAPQPAAVAPQAYYGTTYY